MTREEICDIIADVEYKDWSVKLGWSGADRDLYLQVVFQAPDTTTRGRPMVQKGRKWRLSRWMTRSEVVQTLLKAILTAEEHEARERFRYRGRAIFGPHLDVEALWESAGRQEKRRDRLARTS